MGQAHNNSNNNYSPQEVTDGYQSLLRRHAPARPSLRSASLPSMQPDALPLPSMQHRCPVCHGRRSRPHSRPGPLTGAAQHAVPQTGD
jgi:hypothetical protein